MKNAPLLNLVLAVALVYLVGHLLLIGRSVLVPIVTAVISVYLMASAADALKRLPALKTLPSAILRALVLVVFAAVVYVFAVVVAATVRDIAAVAPVYQENIEALLARVEVYFDVDSGELLNDAFEVTFGGLDLRSMILAVLGSFTIVGMSIFLVIVYAGFLISERDGFSAKVAAALGDPDQAAEANRLISEINQRIGTYLTVKTAINLILGAVCLVILLVFGADFAFFWAIVIALLNYIPYVGSLLAVIFPVALSLAQTGSLIHTLALGACLITAQVLVGNWLEPRMIGRQLNLSPFVVLVALSIWSALWGVPGAILAVPMTSMIAIVLGAFPATRFVSVLLSARVDED
ncbi:MAG: AI-2E family transporter [Pseudomonadota bacterium]